MSDKVHITLGALEIPIRFRTQKMRTLNASVGASETEGGEEYCK